MILITSLRKREYILLKEINVNPTKNDFFFTTANESTNRLTWRYKLILSVASRKILKLKYLKIDLCKQRQMLKFPFELTKLAPTFLLYKRTSQFRNVGQNDRIKCRRN